MFYDAGFTLKGATNRLNSIKKEYTDLGKFNLRKPRREELRRIIEISEEIENEICD